MPLNTKSFSGKSPGQSLKTLVSRFSYDSVVEIIGQETISLLKGVESFDCSLDNIRSVSAHLLKLRAYDLLSKKEIRSICLSSMSQGKLEELSLRIGLSSPDLLYVHDPTTNIETWKSFLNFFGIDTRGAAPYAHIPTEENIGVEYGLFPYQREMVSKVENCIQDRNGRLMLHMPTGSGKTRTAMHVICRFLSFCERAVVVWLASGPELLEQAASTFRLAWSYLGNRDIKIVRFWGDYSPELEHFSDGIVIAGFKKMYNFKHREPIEMLRLSMDVRLVIVDEAHQAIAPTYKEITSTLINTGKKAALVGLSATPGRSWHDINRDEKLSAFFDGNKIMLSTGEKNPIQHLIDDGYLAKPNYNKIEVLPDEKLKEKFYELSSVSEEYNAEILDALAINTARNIAIIEEIKRLIELKHSRIIFFGASVDHAELIACTLIGLKVDAKIVTAKTESNERNRILKAYLKSTKDPIVICNYGVLTTGFDAPSTSAAIIARPTRSLVLYSQMVGRATRGIKAGGNKECEISTVVDIDLPGFGDMVEAFMNWEDVWNGQ